MEGEISISVSPTADGPPDFKTKTNLCGSLTEQAEALAVLAVGVEAFVRNYVDSVHGSHGKGIGRSFEREVARKILSFREEYRSGKAEVTGKSDIREV